MTLIASVACYNDAVLRFCWFIFCFCDHVRVPRGDTLAETRGAVLQSTQTTTATATTGVVVVCLVRISKKLFFFVYFGESETIFVCLWNFIFQNQDLGNCRELRQDAGKAWFLHNFFSLFFAYFFLLIFLPCSGCTNDCISKCVCDMDDWCCNNHWDRYCCRYIFFSPSTWLKKKTINNKQNTDTRTKKAQSIVQQLMATIAVNILPAVFAIALAACLPLLNTNELGTRCLRDSSGNIGKSVTATPATLIVQMQFDVKNNSHYKPASLLPFFFWPCRI